MTVVDVCGRVTIGLGVDVICEWSLINVVVLYEPLVPERCQIV